MKKLIALLLASLSLAGAVQANTGGMEWDKFPKEKMSDMAALQTGAKLFVNYCLNCHSAAYMRYNRMRDIGLSEVEIKNNLLFAADKVGETMKVSLDPKEAKAWFGANPPDLSVIARSRADGAKGSGADYLYTYMRNFYRDDTKATGWNNLAFPSVAMPHVMWELQGQRAAKFEEVADRHDHEKKVHAFAGYEPLTPGKLNEHQYDEAVADLVAYLQWMGEPAQGQRFQLGVVVLIFLGVLTVFAWRLNASFWKDVK
ncbi:cytochrome c1 [Roseateles saccharophilus]|uniref:Ubiquinol-cytochrome c reductase cytochrome c1 subunit n=1 Tax=Roseateles saccharophilus TaxID=304 RepID=A0A4R3UCS2_ROSSA|nr:cytochrome c1 [Roseateles saccharophilus]MDG0835656.1 cytochrome c1 [Roseateles saccharophilus]TCU85696.1 ubiquinol-cytochrome c reductase cytochrome c1 subunit [Roseateles saccharophilus]